MMVRGRSKLRYPSVDRSVAFEPWANAADHALLAAIAALMGHANIDILTKIDQARELLADGRGERDPKRVIGQNEKRELLNAELVNAFGTNLVYDKALVIERLLAIGEGRIE